MGQILPHNAALTCQGQDENETVVIVDDDEPFRYSLQILLETMGYATLAFEDGKAFMAHPQLPAKLCCLLDYNLPDGSGLELMTAIAARNPSTPMILISGNANKDVKRSAQERGALAALDKPLDDDLLFGLLDQAFKPAYAQSPM